MPETFDIKQAFLNLNGGYNNIRTYNAKVADFTLVRYYWLVYTVSYSRLGLIVAFG